MRFNQRPVLGHRCLVDIGHHLNRMGIAHRYGRDHHVAITHHQRLHHLRRRADEGNFLGLENRHAHVDSDQTIRFQARADDAGHGLNTNLALVGEPLVMDEAYEATGTVAALLHFTAIGIENAIAEIDARLRSGFHQQNLVAADAEMAIGQMTKLLRCQRQRLTNAIENDKVVAQSVHLRELEFHGICLRQHRESIVSL